MKPIAASALALLGIASISARAEILLYEPTGPYHVTQTQHVFNHTTPDDFTAPNGTGEGTQMLVTIYAPTLTAPNRTHPYIDATNAFIWGPALGLSPSLLSTFATPLQPSAPLHLSPSTPTILFLPGAGMPCFFYTSLLSELASSGYFVVALDHPGEPPYLPLPDGHGGAKGAFPPLHNYTWPQYERIYKHRVADAQALLSDAYLPALVRERGWGALDLRKVGVFGHNANGTGSTAATVHVAAGANLDGWYFFDIGDLTGNGTGTPYPDLARAGPFLALAKEEPRVPDATWARFGAAQSGHGDGTTDDSAHIAAALAACNGGGHVLFPATQSYVVGEPLDMSGLASIDIDIQGAVAFTDDIPHWLDRAFDLGFQNATSFFKLGGADVHVYGGGTIDGRGQAWWDNYAENKHDRRPVLFATVGMHGGSVSDLRLVNSPFWHNFVANSSEVVFTNISIRSVSDNENFEKNTDGWDIYRSDHITIQNSSVTNGDDCVSFKPNSTNILVQNMSCNGTHGMSVGSLGQYPGRVDYVENVLVRNAAMYNSSEGARIKVWPDAFSEKSATLAGGGGRGRVRNVTYDGMWLDNVDYGLTVTQCYGQDDEEECFKHPSKLNITDVTFRNVRGRSNRVFSPIVAHLVCSSPDTCSNIVAENIDIRTINGSNLVTCRNMDEDLLDVNCVDWSKGYNPA
ncbi:putative extracellular exo-polygalacturonase [Diplodia seriata]|uniref:galacturonan 1,4-alpha-galacturonidase n=1 Tax=Diplodia seriata TaxID=420778 RepID=A0A0G2DWA7_9PEZI|nr:putative extracellular exo-polygalacturonase [Diplodia seriata]